MWIWIHVAIYKAGISGMVNIQNLFYNMKKVVQNQVFFKFWGKGGFDPKNFKQTGP